MKSEIFTRHEARRAAATELVSYRLSSHANLLYRHLHLFGGDKVLVAMGITPDIGDLVVVSMKDGGKVCGVYQSASEGEVLLRCGATQADCVLILEAEIAWIHPVMISTTQNFDQDRPDGCKRLHCMPEVLSTPPTPVLTVLKTSSKRTARRSGAFPSPDSRTPNPNRNNSPCPTTP